MLKIIPVKSFRIAEDGGRLLEGLAVLPQVGICLARVSREHINVYTLINSGCQ